MDGKVTAIADVQVQNHGTVFLIFPMTPEANDWLDAHIAEEGSMWWGSALVVEHRYALDLVEGMKAEGLRVI